MRSLTSCLVALAALVALPAFASGPNGPHCWCEIATDCPKDDHQTVYNFGAIAQYGKLESGKQRKCADACALASGSFRPTFDANLDLYCERLGDGVYDLHAYSKVGHTDTRNNWCDPDDFIGRLTCTTTCTCPPGYSYDPGVGQCTGWCNGLYTMTRPEDCDTVGTLGEPGDPCDPVPLGRTPLSVVSVDISGEDGTTPLEDLFGDLDIDEVLDHLGLEAEDDPIACDPSEPICE